MSDRVGNSQDRFPLEKTHMIIHKAPIANFNIRQLILEVFKICRHNFVVCLLALYKINSRTVPEFNDLFESSGQLIECL